MLQRENNDMKKAVIIGSGAAGATAARELQGKYEVTIVEAGASVRPFRFSLSLLERLRYSNLFFSEQLIRLFIPAYRIRKTPDKMALVWGIGAGGTTKFTCGNALRADAGLRAVGINLDPEFSELEREIPITADHRHLWRETTSRLYAICESNGLKPFVVPKAGRYDQCRNCGQCTLGCPHGVKWDASEFIDEALGRDARLMTGCRATRIVTRNSRSTGVMTNRGFLEADLVIVAAGGVNSPRILENSGISVHPHFFVDPVLCVAAEIKNAYQNKELPMPFAVQEDGYILSPYFDQLSFFFNPRWKLPAKNIFSFMIKLADSETGTPKSKLLTQKDRTTLERAVLQCKELLSNLGVRRERTFLGMLNAGHPGGMLPLTKGEAQSMHAPKLPDNVYVADATLFPASLGNPPMLTIMALAKRVARIAGS
jgi:choline dehydrogenase-like flavoprotein